MLQRLLGVATTVLALSACSGKPAGTSVLAPSEPAAPTPPASVALSGRVTQAPPTQVRPIMATLTIASGPDTGASVTADGNGRYSFAGLRPGAVVVEATAPGYVLESQQLTLAGNTTADFRLRPEPRLIEHTWTGQLTASGGTCSDGDAQKPCIIVAFSMHNPGRIEATLGWSPATTADLNLALFQTGVPTPIERSTASGSTPERISVDVPGGAHYELRITYANGTGPANYEMPVAHPN